MSKPVSKPAYFELADWYNLSKLRSPIEGLERSQVPDHKVSWSVDYDDYQPTTKLDDATLNAPWADHNSDILVIHSRNTLPAQTIFDKVTGTPLNPYGRTGFIGGKLGRLGCNPSSFVIALTGSKQFLMVRAKGRQNWGFPGGFVDGDEIRKNPIRFALRAAAARELKEETGVTVDTDSVDFAKFGDSVFCPDMGTTDDRWVAATFNTYRLSGRDKPKASSEIEDLAMFSLKQLKNIPEVFPLHRVMAQRLIASLR
jgi:8-oxo-dGTP pyrophosphatase MutT (NUDIX family)